MEEMKHSRKPRKDRGPRITDRDLDALEWIAQQYCVTLDHLSILLARLMDYSDYAQKPHDPGELTEKRTAKVVKRWEQLGLVERAWILYDDAAWVWCSQEGLRLVAEELGELRPYTPTPAKVNHLYWCNHARLYVEQGHNDAEWRSERQLRANQKSERGIKRPHVPDAVVTIDGQQIAIEVELSTKTYSRLDKILHELATSDYHTTWYFVRGRAKQVIETAIENMTGLYSDRFVIYDVDECEIE
jgi:hypothetical protein